MAQNRSSGSHRSPDELDALLAKSHQLRARSEELSARVERLRRETGERLERRQSDRRRPPRLRGK